MQSVPISIPVDLTNTPTACVPYHLEQEMLQSQPLCHTILLCLHCLCLPFWLSRFIKQAGSYVIWNS